MRRWLAAGLLGVAATSGGVATAGQDDPRLEALFATLRTSDDPVRVAEVERRIWEIWLQSGDEDLDHRMQRGVVAMNHGDFETALAAFEADGLVEISGSRLRVPDDRKAFVRVVASAFDKYLGSNATKHSVAV